MHRFRSAESLESLRRLERIGLLTPVEAGQLHALGGDPALDECLSRAETVHVHVKVEDTDALPLGELAAAGAVLDHGKPGFVKFRLPGAVNAIFSHIPVSDDDLREAAGTRRPRPFLDHIGVDLRSTDERSRAAFASLDTLASTRGWRTVSQGGEGQPVRCCHVEVLEKRWLFPTAPGARPVEFAFGPLRENAAGSGCDLRPSSSAETPKCCGAARPPA
ncbi:hypothetical protein BWI17_13975 [Betaproteobacteria bacterium GR16-43]|nr:hypothetical protein BWI17_13975 [Betaproteobacteria bacterium GR16-43]